MTATNDKPSLLSLAGPYGRISPGVPNWKWNMRRKKDMLGRCIVRVRPSNAVDDTVSEIDDCSGTISMTSDHYQH